LTLGALEIWHSQPNKENQEVAELFGLVLCRVLLQCPIEGDKWKDIAVESLPLRSSFGNAFIQAIVLASKKHSSQTAEDDQRILFIAAIHTAVTRGIDLKQYQWLKSCRLLDGRNDTSTALLSIWSRLAVRIGRAQQAPRLIGYGTAFEKASSSQEELAENLALALLWMLKSIQSLQGDPNSELNAAEGFAICLQRARELCQNDSDLPAWIVRGLGDLIWSYIDHLATSGSTEIRLVKLSIEALLTFRTFLSSGPSSSGTPSTSSDEMISSAVLIDTIADVLIGDLTCLTSQDREWKSKGRTFKACIIRTLLWIWRNHPDRNPDNRKSSRFFESSCRLWAPLEKEVSFSKTGSFGDEDKPLTRDDLKGVAEFAEWARSQAIVQWRWEFPSLIQNRPTSAFIMRNADVGINRLYAHFDHGAEWDYHLYNFHEEIASCSRSAYTEDGML
ncbi:hypothetical protein FRC01_005716, partial [Tulasnella sp. 417]